MKKYTSTLILIFCLLFNLSYSFASTKHASISFEKTTHDFGSIKEEIGKTTCTFNFKNVGEFPLIIYRTISSCGCTTSNYSLAPIAPGKTSSINVTYNTANRPGIFTKTVTLYTNDPEHKQLDLVIKGNVIPRVLTLQEAYPISLDGLRINKVYLSILNAKIGKIANDKISYVNDSQKDIHLSFNNVPSFINILAPKKIKAHEKGDIIINYDAKKAHDYGKREDVFYIKANNSENKEIKVSAFLSEDFSALSKEELKNAPLYQITDSRITFGKMEQNKEKQMTTFISNGGKKDLIIRKIYTDYSGLVVKSKDKIVKPGQTTKITIVFNSGVFSGYVVKKITIFTNDPYNSMNRIFITAEIKK